MDVSRIVQHIVGRYAGQPFLIDSRAGRVFAYGECDQMARGLAAVLRRFGVRPDDRVALLLPNSVEFALLYLGCLYAGAVAVPINAALHPEEVGFILRHSGARLVVYSGRTCELLESVRLGGAGMSSWRVTPSDGVNEDAGDVQQWLLSLKAAGGTGPEQDLIGDRLFSITFTSGTTGTPKGIAHRAATLLENAAAFNREQGVSPADRFLHVFPMAYMAGFLNTLLCPFMAGASVVIARSFDAQMALRFWDVVVRYSVDTFWLAPTMLAALLRVDRGGKGPEYCRDRVKRIWVGTAPLPLKIKEDFEQKYGVRTLESYGLSELLLVSANSGDVPAVEGSVGRVLPGIEVKMVDDHGTPVAQGDDGEIQIRTPYVMAGYLDYKTLEPTPVSLADWFPTGDVGHVNGDGHLFITGRKKDVIIRGGVNVSSRSVEDVLLKHQAVADVAVVGVPHELYGEEVVAAVRLKAGRRLEMECTSLAAFCRAHLGTAAVPTRFVEIERFPTSATGKIQKGKLREQLTARKA